MATIKSSLIDERDTASCLKPLVCGIKNRKFTLAVSAFKKLIFVSNVTAIIFFLARPIGFYDKSMASTGVREME